MGDLLDRAPASGVRIEYTLDGDIAVRMRRGAGIVSYREITVTDGVADCRRYDTGHPIVRALYDAPGVGVMVGPYDENGTGSIVNSKYIEKMKQLFGW